MTAQKVLPCVEMATLLYIAPDDPWTGHGGSIIGIQSDLGALLAAGLTVSVLAFHRGNTHSLDPDGRVNHVYWCGMKGGGRLKRTLRAMLRPYPPSSERLYPPGAPGLLKNVLEQLRPRLVFLHDFALGGYIEVIRRAAPTARIVVRANNLMHDVTGHQLKSLPLGMKPAAWFEHYRWRKFEARTAANCDDFWCVTRQELDAFRTIYKQSKGSFVPVGIDTSRYEMLPIPGRCSTLFANVGTVDLRRYMDLGAFYGDTWLILRSYKKEIRSVVAGSVTVPFGNTFEGVDLLGPVPDDAELYGRCRFALNTQTAPGGIKLKSLTAMAAGCTLLSTWSGVEGMDVQHGVHYWNMEVLASRNELKAIFHSEERNEEIARCGREWVRDHHGRIPVSTRVEEALRRWV